MRFGKGWRIICQCILPIMQALCLMLLVTYYALSFAGIISWGLLRSQNVHLFVKNGNPGFQLTSYSFCLVEKNGKICLSKSHGYFYQVQAQIHVTNLKMLSLCYMGSATRSVCAMNLVWYHVYERSHFKSQDILFWKIFASGCSLHDHQICIC